MNYLSFVLKAIVVLFVNFIEKTAVFSHHSSSNKIALSLKSESTLTSEVTSDVLVPRLVLVRYTGTVQLLRKNRCHIQLYTILSVLKAT